MNQQQNILGDIAAGVIGLFLVVALIVGGASGCKSWSRYQKRADANNNVEDPATPRRQPRARRGRLRG